MNTPAQQPVRTNPFVISLGVLTGLAFLAGIFAFANEAPLVGGAILSVGGLALITTLAVQAILWQLAETTPTTPPES